MSKVTAAEEFITSLCFFVEVLFVLFSFSVKKLQVPEDSQQRLTTAK